MSLIDALVTPFATDGVLVELVWRFGIILIIVISLDLAIGYTGMFHLGPIGFYALGAIGTTFAVHPMYLGLDMFSGILLGWLFTTAAVLLVGLPTLRLTGDYFAIATLGFALSTQLVLLAFWANGIFGIPSHNPFGCDLACLADTRIGAEIGHWATTITFLDLPNVSDAVRIRTGIELVILAFFVITTYIVVGRVKHSPYGRVLKAVREDRRAAEALGKNTKLLRFQAFWIAALIQSLAGSLVVHHRGVMSPSSMGFEFLILTLLAVIAGGLGSHFGALVGTALVVLFNEISISTSSWLGDAIPLLRQDFSPPALRLILFGALLVTLMLVRPQGLLGERDVTLRGLLARLRGRPQEDAQADPEGGAQMEERP